MPEAMMGESAKCPECHHFFLVRDLIAEAAQAANLIPFTPIQVEEELWTKGVFCAICLVFCSAIVMALTANMAVEDRGILWAVVGCVMLFGAFFIFRRAWPRGLLICGILLLVVSIYRLDSTGEIGGGFLALIGLGLMFWIAHKN